jgi:hypothetical protein
MLCLPASLRQGMEAPMAEIEALFAFFALFFAVALFFATGPDRIDARYQL